MTTFKIGDWVESTAVYCEERVFKLTENNFYLTKVENSNLKLWEPKQGEWCWVWDEDVSETRLRKFKEFNKDTNTIYRYRTYNLGTSAVSSSSCIEPFIGELPTFLERYM